MGVGIVLPWEWQRMGTVKVIHGHPYSVLRIEHSDVTSFASRMLVA